ncbi:MAG: response regulator [Acidobacteria bacterium]|nr:response regulator [Acidobacteriota bacterium]
MHEANRLLLVDDESGLLDLMRRYLTRLGYEVDAYTNAHAALQRFESQAGYYALVVADLSMPGMSGDELLSQVLALNPRIHILVCSGYQFSKARFPKEVQKQIGFLQKPFLPKMLAEAVEGLMQGPPGSADPS